MVHMSNFMCVLCDNVHQVLYFHYELYLEKAKLVLSTITIHPIPHLFWVTCLQPRAD